MRILSTSAFVVAVLSCLLVVAALPPLTPKEIDDEGQAVRAAAREVEELLSSEADGPDPVNLDERDETPVETKDDNDQPPGEEGPSDDDLADVTGLTQFPSFLSGFFNHPFFNGMTPKRVSNWWEGDNVCVERDVVIKPPENSSVHGLLSGIMMSTSASFDSCQSTPNKFVCTNIRTNSKGTNKTVVTYQCCPGHRLIDGKCQKFEVTPVAAALKDKAPYLYSLIMDSGNEDLLQVQNVTIFAPVNLTMSSSDLNDAVETNDVQAVFGRPDQATVRPLIRRHMVPKVVELHESSSPAFFHSHSHIPNQILTTEMNSTIRVNVYTQGRGNKPPMVTANCVPLVEANVLVSSGVLHTVKEPLPEPKRSLLELLESNPNYAKFYEALQTHDLLDVVQSMDGMTVFALSNDAMAKLNESHNACLRDILKSHLIPLVMCSAGFDSGITLVLPSGEIQVKTDDDNNLLIGNAKVILSDVMATDGVLHEISDPILTDDTRSLEDVLGSAGREDMANLLRRVGPLPELSSPGRRLFLVPLRSDLADQMEVLNSLTDDNLRELIRYHIIDKNEKADQRRVHLSVKRNSLEALIGGGQNLAECQVVSEKSVGSCSAEIRLTERVMWPPNGTLYDLVQSTDELSGLQQLLQGTKFEAELREGLQGPVTILAPSKAAFEAMDERHLKRLRENKEAADTFLRKHVLEGFICCESVPSAGLPLFGLSDNNVKTLAGTTMRSTRAGGVTRFGPSTVSECNLRASDGLIHILGEMPIARDSVKIRKPHQEIILAF